MVTLGHYPALGRKVRDFRPSRNCHQLRHPLILVWQANKGAKNTRTYGEKEERSVYHATVV